MKQTNQSTAIRIQLKAGLKVTLELIGKRSYSVHMTFDTSAAVESFGDGEIAHDVLFALA